MDIFHSEKNEIFFFQFFFINKITLFFILNFFFLKNIIINKIFFKNVTFEKMEKNHSENNGKIPF